MVEPQSDLNEFQVLSIHSDLDDFFTIPAIHSSEMSESEWQQELKNHYRRQEITQAFVDGRVSPSDFMEGLAAYGVFDPNEWAESWNKDVI